MINWGEFQSRAKLANDASGCLLFGKSVTTSGYGQMKIDGKMLRAHRIAWEIIHGPIPSKLQVLHKCDVRLCCNPDHLYLGSNSDNVRDRVSRCRNGVMRGERGPGAKLTRDQAMRIIKDSRPQSEIADEYGIGQQQVSNVKRGICWKNLPRVALVVLEDGK